MLESTLFRGIDFAGEEEQNQRHGTTRLSMGVRHKSKMNSITIPGAGEHTVTAQGSWKQTRYHDWAGLVTSPDPIVAISFLQVGQHVEWARSEKGPTTSLELRVLLAPMDSDEMDVSVSFSIGNNGPRWRTSIPTPDFKPTLPSIRTIQTGTLFSLGEPFGSPALSLFGIILLREHTKCARNGVWHLKNSLLGGLTQPLVQLFSYGRAGHFEIN